MFSKLFRNGLVVSSPFTFKFTANDLQRQNMNNFSRYRLVCTLSFGDIYGQIIVWLVVIFISLAAAMALMGAARPIYALATVGLVLVVSLPFLLFAFVTTLLNHIEFKAVDASLQTEASASNLTNQRPAQAAS
jgi:quinol-cytochrome oxidoreductase complex cytochrome b subunit